MTPNRRIAVDTDTHAKPKAAPRVGASLSGFATFQPNMRFDIAEPVGNVVDPVGTHDYPFDGLDLQFYYKLPDAGGDKFAGTIEIVPEPAMACVLVAGAVAVLRRRRHERGRS